jgi:hypothetical protein
MFSFADGRQEIIVKLVEEDRIKNVQLLEN